MRQPMIPQRLWMRMTALSSLTVVSIGLAIGVLWLSQKNQILGRRIPGDFGFGGFVLLSAICLSLWACIVHRWWNRMGIFKGGKQKGDGPLAGLAVIGRLHFRFTFILLLIVICGLYLIAVWFLASAMARMLWEVDEHASYCPNHSTGPDTKIQIPRAMMATATMRAEGPSNHVSSPSI